MNKDFVTLCHSVHVRKSEQAAILHVSNSLVDIVFKLYLNMDKENRIHKNKLQGIMHWKKDYRSWKRYWQELVDKEVVVFLDKETVMINPNECYCTGVAQSGLLDRWNKLCN